MKRLLPFILVVAMVLSAAGIAYAAPSADDVLEFEDFTSGGGRLIVLWDRILRDDEAIGASGGVETYLEDYENVLGGPAEKIGISGWLASDYGEIASLGYMIDGGAPVLDPAYMVTTDDAVKAAAQTQMCDYVTRYYIQFDVASVTGDHIIDFVVQFEDGTVVKLTTNTGLPVSYEYSADGSKVPATPEPTTEPDPSTFDNAPGPIFRFDEEEKYVAGGIFGGMTNMIDSITFDDEKKCYVITMTDAGDPWAVIMFNSAALEDEDLLVDADKYKIMQIGIRYDAETHFTRGNFYFQTDVNAGFDEPKDVTFDAKATKDLQYVNVNLGANKKWTGYMADCRLDPMGSVKGTCEYEVYYFAFFTNVAAANEFGEKWLAEGDSAISAATEKPTKEPTAEPTEAPATEAPAVTPAPTDVPATDAASATDAPAATDKPGDNSGGNDAKGPNTGLIIGIAAGACALAAVVAGVIVGVSKKKK